MKNILMATVLAAMALAIAPQVQAQDITAIERELGQITERGIARGGTLTAQETARAKELMIQLFVAQGIPRAQAQGLADQAVAQMMNPQTWTEDNYQEDPEAIRRFQEFEEQQRQGAAAQAQWEREQQQERQEAEQRRLYPGDTRGWPAAAWFRNLNAQLASLRQPAGTNASYDREGHTVYLSGGNANTVMQDLVRQINSATGKTMTQTNNGSYNLYIPDGRAGWNIWVEQEDGTVRLRIWWSM